MGFVSALYSFRLIPGPIGGGSRFMANGMSRRSTRTSYIDEEGWAPCHINTDYSSESKISTLPDLAEYALGPQRTALARTCKSIDNCEEWLHESAGADLEREGTESPIYRPPPKSKQDGKPLNFGIITPGVYRSGFPMPEDYHFLGTLGLKTIITLRKTTTEPHYAQFMESHGITHKTFDMLGTKKVAIPATMMLEIMAIVLNPENHPLLIHCNHGIHRTGCAAAVLKLIHGHDTESIIQEYKDFAAQKVRECDLTYIRSYDISVLQGLVIKANKAQLRPTPNDIRWAVIAVIVVLAFWILFSLF